MWILVNIGCLECGVSSDIVGVFDNEAAAQAYANKLEMDRKFSWRGGGQNSYEVFKLPAVKIINPEYVL